MIELDDDAEPEEDGEEEERSDPWAAEREEIEAAAADDVARACRELYERGLDEEGQPHAEELADQRFADLVGELEPGDTGYEDAEEDAQNASQLTFEQTLQQWHDDFLEENPDCEEDAVIDLFDSVIESFTPSGS